MPELPDLAVFSENLQARLQGRTVFSVECHNRTIRLNTSPEKLRDSLCNTSIVSVRRAGKEIAFVFSNQVTLSVHLMVQGRFTIATDPHSEKFRILILRLEEEALVISDPKGLVSLTLNPPPNLVPDALEVDGAYFRRKLSERPKMRVKAFLLEPISKSICHDGGFQF